MIELAWETPAGWGERVLERPLELLADHAHCELQAALSAQSLLARDAGGGDAARVADRLAALAIEEMRHFREVAALLHARGGALDAPGPNPYVLGLRTRAAASSSNGRLDRLLVAALVERRSLERFERLAAEARDPEIAALYGRLAPSERGHALLFVELAEREVGAEAVAARLAELVPLETGVARSVPFAARIHGGPFDESWKEEPR